MNGVNRTTAFGNLILTFFCIYIIKVKHDTAVIVLENSSNLNNTTFTFKFQFYLKIERGFQYTNLQSDSVQCQKTVLLEKACFVIVVMLQGNSQKGLGRCRLSCFLHYIHYLSISPHTTAETTPPQTFS